MELTLNAPALLFPTVSLLLLAYTNRFLAIASLIRNLHAKYKDEPDPLIWAQIKNLKRRVTLIRDMQVLGVASLFLCVLCMFLIFGEQIQLAKYVFGASLVLMMASLGYSMAELYMSIKAIEIQLSDIEEKARESE
ncbi:DUF2721 domain-containing protein [Rhodocytophaga rosea]|uniref:DUF2721 domain-containing protein n=1 Tax=Rhodocytophaga rosea TaxID=2704465 RepID=A0A6C0GW30_9BACT|nr:DUF2721 domain-containing protein [Rhodocytophaga rosea]QHT71542.1 DUF2721 domain-containing protein [Rhodocytophaga rosea]